LNRISKDFKDPGAIMVGAALSNVPHGCLWLSNYGSRIDVYGWSQNVDTTSVEPSRSAKNLYTSSFNGTSSALPIIAGTAISIQSIAKEYLGHPYKPSELRNILSNPNTGTQPGEPSYDRIGILPDLKAILLKLGFQPNGEDPASKHLREQEPHNQDIQANPIDFNTTIEGNLNDNDKVDIYTFTIHSPQNIDISVLNEKQIGMTWTLYHESDLQNVVAYGKNNSNVITGEYNTKLGKYYLHVYKYENKNGTYLLNIK
jgi:hypothetical protein